MNSTTYCRRYIQRSRPPDIPSSFTKFGSLSLIILIRPETHPPPPPPHPPSPPKATTLPILAHKGSCILMILFYLYSSPGYLTPLVAFIKIVIPFRRIYQGLFLPFRRILHLFSLSLKYHPSHTNSLPPRCKL